MCSDGVFDRVDETGEEVHHYYCACPTNVSLSVWFKSILRLLKRHGFNRIELTLDRPPIMGYSGRQCFFKKEWIVSRKILVSGD